MKKIAAIALSCAMLFSISACGRGKSNHPTESTILATAEEMTTVTNISETTTEVATSSLVEETKSETSAAETTHKNETVDGDLSPLTNAILPTDTSADAPAPLGQPVEVAIYSTADKHYHAVYVAIDKVTTATKDSAYVNQCFVDNNAVANQFNQIDPESLEIPDDVEFCVVDYTITIPETFNASEYGPSGSSVHQRFVASNPTGGGIPTKGSVYIGMGSVESLETVKDATYFPGNTYKLRGAFNMVKGYEEYVFKLLTYPDGTGEDLSGKGIDAFFSAK